jgi:peptidyl-prolyl cis-trans isomerase D
MLEAFRNGAKSWPAKVFLGLLLASFAVWGIQDVFRGVRTADLVEVGGRGISSEVFRQDLNKTLQQFSQQTGTNVTLEEARKLGLDKQVLDRMIAEAAVDAQGERLKIVVGDKAVGDGILTNKLFLDSSGKFDRARFQNILQQNNLTEPGYVALEKADMLRRSFSGTAGDNVTLPRTLVDALTRYRDETRDARYVSFSVNASDVPAPTDTEIQKQYESAPTAYTAPEYRSIAVIKVEATDIAAKVDVTDVEVTQAYESSKAEYFKPEMRDIIQLSFADVAAADKARARIVAGEDILKVAAELGQKEADVSFKERTKADFLDEKMGEAAFALKEGELSAPVKGSLNTAVFKVVKITPEHQPTLAELSQTLKDKVRFEKAREEIQSVYDAVEDARAQQTKFEDIAARAGIPIVMVSAVSAAGLDKAGKPVELVLKDEVVRAAFAGEVGVEVDALQVGDGYVWLEVRGIIPSAVKPLAEVKDQVKADWAASKLRNLASEKAKAIVDKAGSTTKLESIATELNSRVETVSGLKRNETSEKFDGVATIALFSVAEKSLTWALEGDGKTARIIEVAKVTAPTMGASASAKEIADVARQGLSSDLTDSYLKTARNGTTVVLNEDLWRKIDGATSQ